MSIEPSYRWQQEAIAAWDRAERWGIVEAVTGSGKTHVAIESLLQLSDQIKHLSTLVVVPTVPLMEQWYEKLSIAVKKQRPNERIGRIGGKYRDRFAIPPIAYVATICSALRHATDRFEHCWTRGFPSLLIADECHHYLDAPVWSRIVKEYAWTYRMGLSATVGPFEIGGLGRIVYEYRFADAFRDGLVPAFDLINTSVELTGPEWKDYFELTQEIRRQFHSVHERYESELRSVPDEWLFKRLQQMMGELARAVSR